MTDTSLRLARFVLNHDPDGFPADASRSLVNFVGCAVGGASHRTVDIAVETLAPHTQGSHRVLGRSERLDAFHAALINGMSSAVLDFDATQAKFTNIHPSGPVLPAVFAVAEMRPVSGRDAMAAYILGVEVACRIANGLFDRDNPGWHVTGVAGGFGAAAAAGRLLGLTEQQMVYAFSIAATQAAGLREMYGTMCKSFTPGRTAQNGLTAAILASAGFDGATLPIEGGSAFARVLTGRDDLSAITDDLGSSYEITLNTYKPFPCAIVTHAAIDGCLKLRERHRLRAEEIQSVKLVTSPLAMRLAGNPSPTTELEAKFSTVHLAALALTCGEVSVQGIGDVSNPAVRDLRSRIETEADDAMGKAQASVEITLSSGARYREDIENAIGSLQNPMDDAAMDRKFRALCTPVLGDVASDRLLDLCRSLSDQESLLHLLDAATGDRQK